MAQDQYDARDGSGGCGTQQPRAGQGVRAQRAGPPREPEQRHP